MSGPTIERVWLKFPYVHEDFGGGVNLDEVQEAEFPIGARAVCVARIASGLGRGVAVADVEEHGDRTLVERLGQGFAGFDPAFLLGAMERAGLERVRRVKLPGPAGMSPELRNGARRGGTGKFEPLRPLFAVGVRDGETRRGRS